MFNYLTELKYLIRFVDNFYYLIQITDKVEFQKIYYFSFDYLTSIFFKLIN